MVSDERKAELKSRLTPEQQAEVTDSDLDWLAETVPEDWRHTDSSPEFTDSAERGS